MASPPVSEATTLTVMTRSEATTAWIVSSGRSRARKNLFQQGVHCRRYSRIVDAPRQVLFAWQGRGRWHGFVGVRNTSFLSIVAYPICPPFSASRFPCFSAPSSSARLPLLLYSSFLLSSFPFSCCSLPSSITFPSSSYPAFFSPCQSSSSTRVAPLLTLPLVFSLPFTFSFPLSISFLFLVVILFLAMCLASPGSSSVLSLPFSFTVSLVFLRPSFFSHIPCSSSCHPSSPCPFQSPCPSSHRYRSCSPWFSSFSPWYSSFFLLCLILLASPFLFFIPVFFSLSFFLLPMHQKRNRRKSDTPFPFPPSSLPQCPAEHHAVFLSAPQAAQMQRKEELPEENECLALEVSFRELAARVSNHATL